MRSTRPGGQLAEVLNRFDLYSQIAPFTRCMVCNGEIERVDKQAVWERLPERTRRHYDTFHACRDCRKVYWKGSHYRSMAALVTKLEHHRNR